MILVHEMNIEIDMRVRESQRLCKIGKIGGKFPYCKMRLHSHPSTCFVVVKSINDTSPWPNQWARKYACRWIIFTYLLTKTFSISYRNHHLNWLAYSMFS